MTRKTPLKRFQQNAVDSAVRVLGECLSTIERTRSTHLRDQNRKTAVATLGHILLEAPTGIGKTLMVGQTVETLSLDHRVIWFWFAPFSGVVGQSINTLKEEHGGLRPRDPGMDRSPDDLASGDVFVTTWSALAVTNIESRKARQDEEAVVSIDRLIDAARAKGYSIGVVVDEAHHGFRGQTQAYKFYREVLDPELTILLTATPRDKDVEAFERVNGVTLNRISVSRIQGVESHLLKRGVKVGVFRTDRGFEEFVDLRKSAIAYGVQTHRAIKETLVNVGIALTPLLLIQVEASNNAVAETQKILEDLGFSEVEVRTHTADEPDPELLAIAKDESVEVLIFKMAVAMGFDAPRAFTLVSLRSTVDENWGVQIVGRIMRVHRKLQTLEEVPNALKYGYVFMSDHERQGGLTDAASRINSIRDELADVTQNVMVVDIGKDGLSVQQVSNGQPTFLPPELSAYSVSDNMEKSALGSEHASDRKQEQRAFDNFALDATMTQMGLTHNTKSNSDRGSGKASEWTPPGIRRYRLRSDIKYPKKFLAAITDPDQNKILDEVIAALDMSSLVNFSLREYAQVHVEKTEIFEGTVDDPETISEKLDDSNIARSAQRTLNLADRDGFLDPRDFRKKLEEELVKEYRRAGLEQANDKEAARKGADRLIALYPSRIKKAIKSAVNRHVICLEADEIPDKIESETDLDPSRKNIYGIIPADMNPWERAFARELDKDEDDVVLWWHRNVERKKWAVRIPVPGFDNYYPDFVVGIRERNKGEGILLVETKERINDADGLAQAKTQVSHPVYGRPMMLYWKEERDWEIVEYDKEKDQNVLERHYRPGLMKTY